MELTRGDAEVITPEQVWAEIGKIFVQRACGLHPTGPVKSGRPQVNVRELLAREG
ncbi:hypothetical protein BE61_52630 [Bradyrhizobium elkanii USDA 61]|nr:hypothetical protein BE61_52630 [Bradyrhizobium elkanii USDA 61]